MPAALLLPLFPILATVVLLGLSQTHSSQHGTSSWQSFVNFISGKTTLNQILSLANQAARALVSHFGGTQLKHLAAYFNAMSRLWKQEFAALRRNADAQVAVAKGIERAIPREAHKAAAPALREAKSAHRIGTQARAAARSTAHDLTRYKASTNARLRADAHAIDVTLPHDIARVRQREEALSRDQAKLRDRTTSLENGATKTFEWIRAHPLSVATGMFAGAVAIALQRIGLGNLRCRNFTNLLKNYGCGLGTLLGRLLPLAIFLGIGFDFKAFVQAAQLVATGIGDAVAKIEGTFNLSLPPLPPPQ